MTTPDPIYLDNAATTRPLPEVVEAMAQTYLDQFGNPSSPHAFADAPRQALEDAREFLKGTLSAANLVFTSGGTEGDLLGVFGSVHHRSPGRVLCAATDHPAILAQKNMLAKTRHKLTPLPTTADGDVDPEVFFDHLGRDVRCVVIQHGHNELGTLSEIDELTSLARRVCPDAHIHIDLVQSYGKIPFDLDKSRVDSVATSAHKLHGPRGVGFLALSSTADVRAVQPAGGQESGLRGGTENVAGAVGFAVAAEVAFSHLADSHAHTSGLAERLFDLVQGAFPKSERLGNANHRLGHILSMRIPGVVGATLLERMIAHGVGFSTGAACHGKDEGESQVLKAIGLSRREAKEVMRFSFSRFNTLEEVDRVGNLLEQEAKFLLAASPKARASER